MNSSGDREDREDSPRTPIGQMMADLHRWSMNHLRYVADLLLPPICIHCHEPIATHGVVCAACWQSIDFITPPLCERLGLPLNYGEEGETIISSTVLRDPPVFARARAVARFDGVMRNLIHGFKYADRHECSDMFAGMMRISGAELLRDADLVMPVPLHPRKLWKRRFNQAAILALKLSELSGHSVDVTTLRRTRRTPSQVGKSFGERQSNVASAFCVAPHSAHHLRGKRILLIDDVMTTGSTLGACAWALKQAGAKEVDCLAIAMVAGDARPDHEVQPFP